MKLEIILKICALGVLCAFTYACVGQLTGSFALAMKIAGTVMVLGVGISLTSEIVMTVFEWEMTEMTSECITLLFRALGICFLCRISSDVCKDCGTNTLSAAVESVGRIVLVIMSIPSIAQVMDYARLLMDKV